MFQLRITKSLLLYPSGFKIADVGIMSSPKPLRSQLKVEGGNRRMGSMFWIFEGLYRLVCLFSLGTVLICYFLPSCPSTLFVFLFFLLPPSVPLSQSISVSLHLFLSLSLCPSMPLSLLSLSLHLSLFVSLCLSLCICLSLSLSCLCLSHSRVMSDKSRRLLLTPNFYPT